MSVKIIHSKTFERNIKQLAKRYKSLQSDLEAFENDLIKNPNLGIELGKGLRKIRLAISSKGKGKKGGARVISYQNVIFSVLEQKVFLLYMYDKSDRDSISDKELLILLKKNNLI